MRNIPKTHTVFELDLSTNKINKASPAVKKETPLWEKLLFWKHVEPKPHMERENCVYRYALNAKNAEKVFKREGYLK